MEIAKIILLIFLLCGSHLCMYMAGKSRGYKESLYLFKRIFMDSNIDNIEAETDTDDK